MRTIKHISIVLLMAVALLGVSSANAKSPAFTTGIEKAVIPTSVEFSANPNGAIIKPHFTIKNYEGQNIEVLYLDKIYWCVDETFYSTGYKAKLSDEVNMVFVPPDSKNQNSNGYKS